LSLDMKDALDQLLKHGDEVDLGDVLSYLQCLEDNAIDQNVSRFACSVLQTYYDDLLR